MPTISNKKRIYTWDICFTAEEIVAALEKDRGYDPGTLTKPEWFTDGEHFEGVRLTVHIEEEAGA